jgi:hypothetical protein
MRRRLFALLLGSPLVALSAAPVAAEDDVRGFLEHHCFECHDSSAKKGGLDLDNLPLRMDDPQRFRLWERVHDRIVDGEMPPKPNDPPSPEETATVLALLDEKLHEADAAKVATTGRALYRRLTRQEYENALRDLLHLPELRIKQLLPEDERRHGYDKIGQALDLSNVHLNQFMDAADVALSAAIATRSVPPPVLRKRFGAATVRETWGWIAKGSVVLLKNKQYDPLLPLPSPDEDIIGPGGEAFVKERIKQLGKLKDYDGAAGFFTGAVHRPMFLSLQFSPIYAGTYRIRTSAWGFWWDRGVVESPHRNESFMLSVWQPSDGPRYFHSPKRWLGLFDAPSLESRIGEYSGWFDVNEELVFDIGTPTGFEKNTGRFPHDSKGSCGAYTGPGIALDWFEVEGPIFEQWPPRSHQALFGHLPIRTFAADAGLVPPKREPVRQRSLSGAVRPQNGEIPKEERERPLETVASEEPLVDAARLLGRFLPRAFRRPVPPEEVQSYVGIVAGAMEQQACFEDAMKEAYKTALCSTDFLFVGEPPDTHVPDPASPAAEATGSEAPAARPRLHDRAIAERLALWFWNSVPDDELITLANEGRLHLPETLRQETDRLLADPRSDRFVADFTDQWLDLRKIDASQPDARLYPEAREHLKQSMIQETRAYLRELITNNESVTHLVQSDFAMLNQSLAEHYRIPDVTGCAIRRVPLPKNSPRGAFLTQAAILKVTANGSITSPVTRGVWINERILGNHIPPPPAGVPTIDPDTRGAKTIREQLVMHRADERCAGCHAKIDPPGFALESFDVIGGERDRYRSTNKGDATVDFHFASGWNPRVRLNLPVDPSGQMPSGERFDGITSFQSLVLENPEALAANMVRQLLMYAAGSGIRYSDRREIDRIVAQARPSHYGLRSLIDGIVQSDLFLTK